MTTETVPVPVFSANSTTFAYDAQGRMTSQANLLGTFTYGYLNNTGRVQSISRTSGASTLYTYQDSVTTPNEPSLTEIKNLNSSSAIISKFDYQNDVLGRVTQWTEQADAASATSWSYGYDPAGQLLSAVQRNSSGAALNVDSYAYDLAGNRLSAQNNGTVLSQTPNSVNEPGATSVGGSLLWQGHANKALYSATLNNQAAAINNSTNFVATVPGQSVVVKSSSLAMRKTGLGK